MTTLVLYEMRQLVIIGPFLWNQLTHLRMTLYRLFIRCKRETKASEKPIMWARFIVNTLMSALIAVGIMKLDRD